MCYNVCTTFARTIPSVPSVLRTASGGELALFHPLSILEVRHRLCWWYMRHSLECWGSERFKSASDVPVDHVSRGLRLASKPLATYVHGSWKRDWWGHDHKFIRTHHGNFTKEHSHINQLAHQDDACVFGHGPASLPRLQVEWGSCITQPRESAGDLYMWVDPKMMDTWNSISVERLMISLANGFWGFPEFSDHLLRHQETLGLSQQGVAWTRTWNKLFRRGKLRRQVT